MADQFYICDMRQKWKIKPYVTFWRPNNAGYAYPLPWAGKYEIAFLLEDPDYYWVQGTKGYDRFPILCRVVENFGVQPAPGMVDGNVGPVIPNSKEVLAALRLAAMAPPRAALQEAGK